MPPLEEYRQCAFCKQLGMPTVNLYKYSTRRFAHAGCLAKKYGTRIASEKVPIGNLKAFRVDLKHLDDWERALVGVRDAAIARARRKSKAA